MGRGKNTLKKHMLRHEDPKYICTECDYKTYDAGNFSTHKSTNMEKFYLSVTHVITTLNKKEAYDSIKKSTISSRIILFVYT